MLMLIDELATTQEEHNQLIDNYISTISTLLWFFTKFSEKVHLGFPENL